MMKMKTINAIIERADDGNYCVFCKDEIFNGMGDTIEEAKEDMMKQMSFFKKTALEMGFKYPEFLDDEFEVKYKIDAASIMKYYVNKGVLTLSGLEKITGINQKQLWSYMNGTKPRRAQQEKIESGLRNLRSDLNAIFA